MSAYRMVRLVRAALLGAAALALVAAPAQAQFGGLKGRLKQKVAEKVAEKAVDKAAEKSGLASPADSAVAAPATAATPADAPPRASSVAAARPAQAEEPTVLPLTAAVLDRFAAALDAERTERAAAAQRKAVFDQKGQEYSQCMVNSMSSPEYLKAGEHLQAAADKNDMKAYGAAVDEQMGVIKAKCGEQPASEDANQVVRKKALEVGHFSNYQYSILEERILPFCKISVSGRQVSLQGASKLVYTAEERSALEPRCGALAKAYDAVR